MQLLRIQISHRRLRRIVFFLAWEQKTLSFLKDRLVINWKLIWSIPSWLILRGRKANFRSQPFESAVGSGLRKVFSPLLTRAENFA